MTNLTKLDETISDLEKQGEIFKQNNKVLSKVADLSNLIENGVSELFKGNNNFETVQTEIHKSLSSLNIEVANIAKQNEQHANLLDYKTEQIRKYSEGFYKELVSTIKIKFDENCETLDKINEIQKAEQEELSNSLLELKDSNKQGRIELSQLFNNEAEQIRKDNKDFYKDLNSTTKQGTVELSKLFNDKIEQIQKDNKDFYKDLDSTIKIKLDDNKSQIKQLIENERVRIKEIFELEFAKNSNELKQLIENESKKQTNHLLDGQKTIKLLIWIFGGLTFVLSLAIMIKLFL